jgi:hypothetical protein
VDKECIKQTMLKLEKDELDHAIEKYQEYFESARLDRTEPLEFDEKGQAKTAANYAESFEQPVHAHSEKIEKLRAIDFGPKTKVEVGAVVKFGGRHFVIAVATGRFVCEGNCLMGISPLAPIYAELEDKAAGDTIEFQGRLLSIEEVH